MNQLNLNASRGRGGRGNGNSNRNPPKENVLVQVVQVHEVNKNAPTKDQDTADVALLHDAFGLKAEFEGDEPKTIVKVRIDHELAVRYKNPDPTKTPLELWDLAPTRKKGSGNRMGKNAIALLEKAYKDNNGDIVVSFLHVAESTPGSSTECAIPNVMATVSAEFVGNDGRARQPRRIYIPEEAVLVTNEEELRAAVISKLEDDRPGSPFAVIRVMGAETQSTTYNPTDPETGEVLKDEAGNDKVYTRYPYEAFTAQVKHAWVKEGEESVALSAAESFERFLTDPALTREGQPIYQKDDAGNVINDEAGNPVPVLRNADIVGHIENLLGAEGVVFEVIGGFSYGTGPLSLPSSKNRLSDHFQYEIDWENSRTSLPGKDRDTGVTYKTTGICASNMLLGRVDVEGRPWYAQKTFVTKAGTGREIFLERELITPNTPEEVAKAFKAQANRRSEALRASFNQNNTAKNAASNNKSDDLIEQDGEPDYTGGMAVSR